MVLFLSLECPAAIDIINIINSHKNTAFYLLQILKASAVGDSRLHFFKIVTIHHKFKILLSFLTLG